MKIPTKNTCSYAICLVIHKYGTRSRGEVVADLKDRFKRETTLDKVSDMIAAGLIGRCPDGTLTLSRPLAKHFDDIEAAAQPIRKLPTGSTATPRTVPAFRPLTGYVLPTRGLRAGSNDHLNLPSRHLP